MTEEEDQRVIKKCLREIRDSDATDLMGGEVMCEVPARLIPKIMTASKNQLGVDVAAFENDVIVDPTGQPADRELKVAVNRAAFEQSNADSIQTTVSEVLDAFNNVSDEEAYAGVELIYVDPLLAPIALERLNLPVACGELNEGADSVVVSVDENAYPGWKRVHQTLFQ